MKIKHLYLFLFLFCQNYTFSQSLFEVGNRWYYYEESWNGQGEGFRDTTYFEIVGDTVMPNGIKYFRMSPSTQWFKDYIRDDSVGIYYYDERNNVEWLFYKYDIGIYVFENKSGDFLKIGYLADLQDSSSYFDIYKLGESNTNIFGDSTKIFSYYYYTGLVDSYNISILPKYGFWGINYNGFFSNYSLTLIGCTISKTNYGEITSVNENEPLPNIIELYQNYPNPFNPTTKIKYRINRQTNVQLVLFDILGNKIAELLNDIKSPGQYYYALDASSLSSGVYFYQLKTSKYSQLRKMIFLK